MELTIKNCNNIESGAFEIIENKLNIKYAINGTGKSTISKALEAFVTNDSDKKKSLLPFKFYNNMELEENSPVLEGYEKFSKISIFNEAYVENYVFQQNELLKNSFEIFVKSPGYDKHINEIEKMLKNINDTFQNHPELDELIQMFQLFIDGFGKAKSGYSATGSIGKGIGKGNKIDNIPDGLELYEPYLKSSENIKWIKWHLEGEKYLNIAKQCPFCSGSIHETEETIFKVNKVYDAKTIEQLVKMLNVFKSMSPYLKDETVEAIDEITQNVSGISDVQKSCLLEIKKEVQIFLQQLYNLKKIGFQSLKNVEKISDELNKYKINLLYYHHLQSKLTKEKVDLINKNLDEVLAKAGKLQGEINKQKDLIKKDIEKYSKEINEFLHYAGYKYQVAIEEEESTTEYHLVLKYIEGNCNVLNVHEHLSYGERNAFALVLFMYSTLKEDSDLVVLDDPISSFDENKRFAIINMLFMGKRSLKDCTVLLLTHEFNTIIDMVYNLPRLLTLAPKASFLTTKYGALQEKAIKKEDIISFSTIARDNIRSDMDTLNKLVYLRRLLEIENKDGLAWQLLSNIFHKRENPIYRTSNSTSDRMMTNEDIKKATNEIKEFIPDFDYHKEYQKTKNIDTLKILYDNSKSNYEKLQIYRIMYNENNSNGVIKKFVNETFHIENDYLFQLNPCKYETVPQYVIDECDKDILKNSNGIK